MYATSPYTGNGVQTNFALTFPYLSQDHVIALVSGVPVAYTWLNPSTITLSPAPVNQAPIKIYRDSSRSNILVDYTNGQMLNERDLDLSYRHALYVAQEAMDLLPTITGQSVFSEVTLSAGRVPFAGSSGLLNDSPKLTFDPLAGTLTVDGQVQLGSGTSSVPSLTTVATANVGLSFPDQYSIYYHVGGSPAAVFTAGWPAFIMANSWGYGISSNGDPANGDTFLWRDAAGVFAQRNGVDAQTYRVYGTYTNGSNYVRAALAAGASSVSLTAETAGTGADDVNLVLSGAGIGSIFANSKVRVVAPGSATIADIAPALLLGLKSTIGNTNQKQWGFLGHKNGAADSLTFSLINDAESSHTPVFQIQATGGVPTTLATYINFAPLGGFSPSSVTIGSGGSITSPGDANAIIGFGSSTDTSELAFQRVFANQFGQLALQDLGNKTGSITLDLGAINDRAKLALTGNVSVTYTLPSFPCTKRLYVLQDSTPRTWTPVTTVGFDKDLTAAQKTVGTTASKWNMLVLDFDGTRLVGNWIREYA